MLDKVSTIELMELIDFLRYRHMEKQCKSLYQSYREELSNRIAPFRLIY